MVFNLIMYCPGRDFEFIGIRLLTNFCLGLWEKKLKVKKYYSKLCLVCNQEIGLCNYRDQKWAPFVPGRLLMLTVKYSAKMSILLPIILLLRAYSLRSNIFHIFS